jgi:hypothetical protein
MTGCTPRSSQSNRAEFILKVFGNREADGESEFAAQKVISLAQEAMLSGKMAACAMHLARATQAGAAK